MSKMQQTNEVIRAMIADIKVESGAENVVNSEIEWSQLISKAISNETAKLYKEWVRDINRSN